MYPVSHTASLAVAVLAAALGVLEFRRLARRDPSLSPGDLVRVRGALKQAPHLILIVLGLLAFAGFFLGVNWNMSIRWSMPMWWQLRGGAILWAALLGVTAFISSLGVAAAYRGGHPRRHRLLLGFVLVVGAIFFLQWNINAPIAPRLKENVTPSGVILQSSGVSCVAASAANITRLYGMDITEKGMAHYLGTTRMGTTVAQLIYGMERLGFSCRIIEERDGAPLRLRAPAVLLVDHPRTPREGHAAAYLGRDGDKFVIVDPTLGRLILTQADVDKFWHGHAVQLDKVEEK